MTLSNDQQMLVQATREFVAKEIQPFAGAWEREAGGAPQSLLNNLGELGYYGLLVPPEFGGAGVNITTYAHIIEELAAGDCGLCNLIAVNNSPVALAIRDHGSEQQRQHYLRALAEGNQRACFMLTESEAGSDAAAIRTSARRVTSGYALNGAKRFVTAGDSADFGLVVARTDARDDGQGISCFLVPRERYSVTRLEDKLGHRNCDTAEVVFDDVLVDDSDRLGGEGDGYRIALAYLNTGRIGVGAQAVGVARAALQAANAYARERQTFGRPIADHQAISFRLADMATQLTAARQLVLHAAALADAGDNAIAAASMAKLFATEMADAVCSAAIQIHGGYGYLKDYPVEKYARDARVLSIYEGTNDIQRIVVSRQLAAGAIPLGEF